MGCACAKALMPADYAAVLQYQLVLPTCLKASTAQVR